ncbi:G-protein gamma-like domain [Sesbania bispinosa]|nr:G-protein gamma-like domain [Sesbania bispinosa]
MTSLDNETTYMEQPDKMLNFSPTLNNHGQALWFINCVQARDFPLPPSPQTLKMQSGVPESANPTTQRLQSLSSADTRGKHRIHAELKRLEQETRFLEEELEQLGRMDKASTPCKELLSNVETRPDPLLPLTIGPLSPTWDRWFEGPQDSKSCCRCWIL